MTFLSPLILSGLLAVALPVFIHLLSRPRLREIRWAASRFLHRNLQKNRRRLRVENLLLLLLRCLLVALLIFIFARPALLTDKPMGPVDKEVSTAVIILDNSASMGQSDGVRTRFDQARAIASDQVAKMGRGSSAALYLISDHVRAVVPEPTTDTALLRKALAEATPTDCGSDLYPALNSAVVLLKASPVHHRDIYIITDSQIAAWRELTEIRELQSANEKQIAFHLLVVGNTGEDNLAISGIQVTGALLATNQPLLCAVQVTNWCRNPVDQIPVKLAIDDSPPQDQAMIAHLEPGASQSVTLTVQFSAPGYHSLTATIPPDRLPADNQRSMALLILAQMRALVVEGTTNSEASLRDGFFLSHALVPVAHDQASRYFVEVSLEKPEDLESPALADNTFVFLSNVGPLTSTAAQNLQRYVNQGGALIVFPGPNTDTGIDNLQTAMNALLPAKLAPLQDAATPEKFLGWQSRGYAHPITELWNDPDSGNLGGVRAFRYFPLSLKPDAPSAQVVVNYTDGEPAVVEQKVGKGSVVLFSSSASTAWTTLPLHPSFVPLLIRIMSYITGNMVGGLNVIAGRPFSCPIDVESAGQTFYVQRPGETARRPIGSVERDDHSARLHYGDTSIAGPYRLFIGNEVVPKIVFAVQGDPAESNLAQEPIANLGTLLNPPEPTGTDEPIEPAKSDASPPRVPGREFWYPLAVTALLLLVVETILAQRVSGVR